MDVESDGGIEEELTPREPSVEDLVDLCRNLNEQGALYVVIGGFAIRHAGYARITGDIDLLVAADLENEAKVYPVLESLPDKAVLELKPGEVAEYGVVRVNDEITVDLMRAACGIDFASASQEIISTVVDGVAIPFASPRFLWMTKATTHRDKDAGDLLFLRQRYSDEIFGEDGPS